MADMQRLLVCLSFVTATALASTPVCPAKCRSCLNNITDCSIMELANPPKDVDKNTKIFNIGGNALRVLGENSFSKLPNVEVLKASGNQIRVVKKKSFKNVPKLMTLDLSNNRIGRMYSQSLIGLSNLKTLNLANNNLQTVTQILDVVPTLFQLNLGSNKIKVLHAKTFYKNVHMHYLDLRYNKLVRVHQDAFKHQKYLRYLFLNNNPLASLPALNMGSPNLQLIDFSHCQLKKVPQGIPPSVSDLRLGHNNIVEIRKRDLENITRLRMLTLNNNKINRVAFMAFSKLKNLQEIWLRDNDLIYIPRGLPDNLKKLYMDSNNVVDIQKAQFANTSQLEYFTVEKNRVQTIEAGSLSKLRFLKYLNLQGNGISTISKGMFSNIRNLTTLTLSNNPINKIESGAFENLENLTSLYMSYVPPSDEFSLEDNFLPGMPNLEKLGLMGSQSLALQLLQIIDDTPVMQHLTELDLTFNDIQTLPPSVQRVFPKIQALSIDGNILNCDHRLLWLAKWMNESDVKFFSYEEPQCEEPENNKGKLLTDVPETDYVEVKQELPPPPPVQEDDTRNVEVAEKVEEKVEEPVQKLKVVQVERVEKIKQRRKGLNPAHRVVNVPAKAAATATTTTAPVASRVEATTAKAPQRVGRRQRPTKNKAANKRQRRLRNRRRKKTDKKRRRKRRHRKTEDDRQRRYGNGRKKNRNRNRNRNRSATAALAA